MVGHPGKCLNTTQWSDLERLYKTKISMREIAQSFGMAENTVLYRLRKITNTYNGFANVD